jgi:CubicO group peptidase (beta-lactamase class C family)
MTPLRRLVVLAAFLLPACKSAPPPATSGTTPVAAASKEATSAPAAPATANAAPPETVAADSPRATGAGHTFTLPANWTMTSNGGVRILVGPEKDIKLALVDVPHATDAADAVKQAWPMLDPKFARPVRITQDVPGRFGWEAVRFFVYETSPNEKRGLFANARRKGDAWCVLLVDGSDAAMERRGAQVNLIAGSLRPAGYTRESFAGKTAHPLDAGRIKTLTDWLERARKAGDVTGVGLGLLEHGKVVFAGGFGVRELGKPAKVDADTLFMIASNTKALSTLLLAKEVDAKKFTWDAPVLSVYPEFKLGNAETTKATLMKHLVCACTGMPRQDLEWIMEWKGSTPASVMKMLGTFQPTSKFGEVFQYSNLMAAAAGFIGGHLLFPKLELGRAYDESMRKEIFVPLGMRATTFDFAKALKSNHAAAHAEDIDGNVKLANMAINYAIIPARPAGGAWSSVNDMLKYVSMELANGKLPDGKTFISADALLARRTPNVIIAEDHTYGMGLMVNKRWGVEIVHHGGDLVGHHSDMFWIPEAGVGGVILTNADPGVMLRGPFVRKLLEVLYDGEPEADEDVMTAIKRNKEAIAVERKRLVVPPEEPAVAKLAKRYHNDSLGDVAVSQKGKDTLVDFGEFQSAVASRHNDDGTYSLFTVDPGTGGIELVVGDKDGKRTLTTRDAQHEYVFVEE